MNAEIGRFRGIRFSAAILTLTGALLSAQALAFLVLLCTLVFQHRRTSSSLEGGEISVPLIVCFGAFGYLCLKAARDIYVGRPWAAKFAIAIGVILIVFESLLIYDIPSPGKAK